MNNQDQMKEEFQEWVESGIWQGEDEYTKNFAVGNVADWWLERFKSYKLSLIQEIEGKKRECAECENHEIHDNEYNQALDTAIEVIKQDTKNP